MTSLMVLLRRTDVRRSTSGIAGMTLMCALAGCERDHTSNADAKQPIAVTASGVEIMEVVTNENERTVEVAVVAGGEEREVTFAPLLDGPLPFGVSVSLSKSGRNHDVEPVVLALGGDPATGATWVRQQSGDDSLELSQVVVGGRVVEEYTFDGQRLHLEYADLSRVALEDATNKYLRGEPPDGSSDLVEFAAALREFEGFAAQLPSSETSENADGELLTSLLRDWTFVSAIVGERVTQSRPDALCRYFNTCAAISCRFFAGTQICTVCVAGSLACMFMDLMCYMWCHGGS